MCKVSAKLDNINITHLKGPSEFSSTVQEWTSLPFDKILCFCQNRATNLLTSERSQLALLVFIRNKRKNRSNVSHDWSKVTYIPNPKPDILGFSYLIRPQHRHSLTNNLSESLIAYHLLLKISKLL